MEHVIAHDLDIATARKVADRAFDEYKTRFAKYSPSLRWISDRSAKASFTAVGYTLKGAIELSDGKITFDLDVPLLLKPFKNIAVEIVERETKRWILEVTTHP